MKNFLFDFKDPKFWASICAWMVPISIFILWTVGFIKCWDISQIGTIIAAIASPFAGLAGFLYIYASFILQQEQMERQSFEPGFFLLMGSLLEKSRDFFPDNPKLRLMPMLKDFEDKYKTEFKQPVPSQDEIGQDENWKIVSSKIAEIYILSFKKSIRGILTLMKRFVGLLLYIDRSNIENKEFYYNLLFDQITQAEMRVYFYGYFHEGFKLKENEKSLIRKFFLRFEGRDLINTNDIYLYKILNN